jgi:hypothetical protein
MILSEKTQAEFENNLQVESSEFEIVNSAKMFDILSNRIYEDVPRAIIRELCCNAIDANIDAGSCDTIKVYLPTPQNPSLIIEDSGIGMTNEDVMTVYRAYGKSTKAGSNKVIGALGIGGKTPLAYTNQFILTTSKDGQKNNYIIFKDDKGIPNVTLVATEPSDSSGTSVEVLIKEEDFQKFYKAAIKTFIFFDKMPTILRGEDYFYNTYKNSYIRSYQDFSVKGIYDDARNILKKDLIDHDNMNIAMRSIINVLSDYNADSGIIMGQIFYNVNTKQLYNITKYDKEADSLINFPITNNALDSHKVLHVDLGSVSIQPSREALNYNEDTINYLKKKFYSHFESWYSNITTNYSTPKKLLNNYDKIKYVDKLRIFREKRSNGSIIPIVTNLATIEESIINEVFNKVNKSSCMISVSATYHKSFEMKDLFANKLTSKPAGDSNFRILFDLIFYNKAITDILIIDDDKMVNKIKILSERANTKSRIKFNCPVAIRNRLLLKNIEKILVVDSDTYNNLSTYLKKRLNVIKYSEFVLPKESIVSGPRKKVDTSGKCYDYNAKRYVNFAEINSIAKNESVVYEFAEGDMIKRGWLYNPKFNEIKAGVIKNKADLIDIYHRGPWENFKGEKYSQLVKLTAKLNIKLPILNHHYLIDWNFFKKNNLMNLKNYHFIDDYVYQHLNAKLSQFEQLKNTAHLYSKTVCDDKTAQNLLDAGNAQIPNFDQTIFGSEMIRIIQERSKPEISLNVIDHDINSIIKILSNKYFSPQEYYTPQQFTLSKKVISKLTEVSKELYLLHTKVATKQVDNVSKIVKKYPMFTFVNFRNSEFYSSNSSDYTQTILDYIIQIEGI